MRTAVCQIIVMRQQPREVPTVPSNHSKVATRDDRNQVALLYSIQAQGPMQADIVLNLHLHLHLNSIKERLPTRSGSARGLHHSIIDSDVLSCLEVQ